MNLKMHAAARPGIRAAFAVLLAILFVGVGTGSVRAQTADTLDSNAKIKVVTAGEPTLSGDFTVDTNGDITMLYVDRVHVKGLTVALAQKEITKRLGTVLRNPQVVVTLESYGGITVEITGAVNTQGPKLLRSDSHLNDVVQLAKPTPEADLSKVEVTHGRPGEAHYKDTVNYLSFLNEKAEPGNPALKDGDSIFVPTKTTLPIDVNIRGEVAKPGRLSVQPKSTVLDVLQAAGGIDQVNADRKGIIIRHTGTTETTTFNYDAARAEPGDPAANPILQDGDTIDVKALARASTYTITGGVLRPGEYPIADVPVTLADAITKAGGSADRAKLDKTTIIRKGAAGTQDQIININAKDLTTQVKTMVQAGDDIRVTPGDPPKPGGGGLLQQILSPLIQIVTLGRVFH
jgi:polysaccharide export outer membrane protein